MAQKERRTIKNISEIAAPTTINQIAAEYEGNVILLRSVGEMLVGNVIVELTSAEKDIKLHLMQCRQGYAARREKYIIQNCFGLQYRTMQQAECCKRYSKTNNQKDSTIDLVA